MREARICRTAAVGLTLVALALPSCKKSATVDPTKIERYGSDELAASGVAYVPEPVAARTGASDQATAAVLVPPGKPLTRVAEKGGFVLVTWAEDSGAQRQGWVSTATAKLSATPVRAERQPGDEVELDPRKIAPPRPAAPPPVAEPSPSPVAATADPAGVAAPPSEAHRPALSQPTAPTPTAAPGTATTQPTTAPAPTAAPAPTPTATVE
jgi:hypothetical protein